MRRILSSYLMTLKERDQFDRILPELLHAMGYVCLNKPQIGVRQYGVDFAAVGDRSDGTKELLLFQIKQGNLGHKDWDSGRNSVRQSVNQIIDVYLRSHLAPEHRELPKVIIVALTGELAQDTNQTWHSFVEDNQRPKRGRKGALTFALWTGDVVAHLLEKHLFDDGLFQDRDQLDLRKALALASDQDYDFKEFSALLGRQLGLDSEGALSNKAPRGKKLAKSISRVGLASAICGQWAAKDGNTMQALWIYERTLLWCWHRIQLASEKDQRACLEPFSVIFETYQKAGVAYYDALSDHFHTQDGVTSPGAGSGLSTLVLHEHIGHLALLGLNQLFTLHEDEEGRIAMRESLMTVATALWSLIINNPASSSPRFDRNVIDITLAMMLLTSAGMHAEAGHWLRELVQRFDFALRSKRHFPIGTDSIDDLIEFDHSPSPEMAAVLTRTSWMIATLAAWCAVYGQASAYNVLLRGLREGYPRVDAQLWHPTKGWTADWYFSNPLHRSGDTEAPFVFAETADELRRRLNMFSQLPEYNWHVQSKSKDLGLGILDFIACRHHRIPVPSSLWAQSYSQETAAALD